MGINRESWRLFAMLRRLNAVDFGEMAMLGRQEFLISPSEVPGHVPSGLSWKVGDYAEPWFHSLGARTLHSFDASDFEGATHVHDFNLPLPENHRDKYTFVLDGGSIEHILNPAQVVANHNALLKVGGHVLIGTQCNGDPAHGFYQLSPEFFYSVLSPRNGFADTTVILIDRRSDSWHMVTPPAVLGRRNNLPDRPFFIVGLARKVSTVLEVSAQQSDYYAQWQAAPARQPRKSKLNWRYRFHNRQYGRFLEEAPLFVPETTDLNRIEY